jgi:hypothetical protein
VLVMSLPIPIIAGNFEKFHREQEKKNRLIKRRANLKDKKLKEERVGAIDQSITSITYATPRILLDVLYTF